MWTLNIILYSFENYDQDFMSTTLIYDRRRAWHQLLRAHKSKLSPHPSADKKKPCFDINNMLRTKQQHMEKFPWKYVLRLKLCSLNDFLLYFQLLRSTTKRMSHVKRIFLQSSSLRKMFTYVSTPSYYLIRAFPWTLSPLSPSHSSFKAHSFKTWLISGKIKLKWYFKLSLMRAFKFHLNFDNHSMVSHFAQL